MGCCEWLNPVRWFTKRQVEEETAPEQSPPSAPQSSSSSISLQSASSSGRTVATLRSSVRSERQDPSGAVSSGSEASWSRAENPVSNGRKKLKYVFSSVSSRVESDSIGDFGSQVYVPPRPFVSAVRRAPKSPAPKSQVSVPVKKPALFKARKPLKYVFTDSTSG